MNILFSIKKILKNGGTYGNTNNFKLIIEHGPNYKDRNKSRFVSTNKVFL